MHVDGDGVGWLGEGVRVESCELSCGCGYLRGPF